eukprot:6050741-Prymnesium_polylepis.2
MPTTGTAIALEKRRARTNRSIAHSTAAGSPLSAPQAQAAGDVASRDGAAPTRRTQRRPKKRKC